MSSPRDAYSEGYAKGKESTVGGALAEVTMGMMRDDPGGHFAAGYRDGAAGKELKLPSGAVRRADAELNPLDDKVAIKTVCPNCRETDWFEWKFLGRLTDPVCGHSWYAGSGTYTLMQFRAAFAAGRRFSKYMNSGVGHGEGAWIAKGMGWFMGTLMGIGCRLEFGILMIPIQALVGLLQPKKTNEEITARVIALAVTLGGLGIGFYELKHQSTPQFQSYQPAGFSSPVPATVPPPRSRVPAQKVRKADAARVILGKWYPQITFIPRAGTTVWEFLPNGQLIEHAFGDANIMSPTPKPVLLDRLSDSKTVFSVNGNALTVGAGSYPLVYKIVGFTPSELVVVNSMDKSPQPFQQRFGRTWQWAMLP